MANKSSADRELKDLSEMIWKKNNKLINPNFMIGFYKYWAKIDAIEKVLIKKKILSRKEIDEEMIPILKSMKKDFED